MPGSFIAAIAPAASSGGRSPAGLAGAAEAAGALGLFGALLERLATAAPPPASVVSAAAEQVDAALGVAELPPASPGVDFVPAAPEDLKTDPEDLLAAVVDALAQLEQLVTNGQPVGPELEHGASPALEALAKLLGIELPPALGADASGPGATSVPAATTPFPDAPPVSLPRPAGLVPPTIDGSTIAAAPLPAPAAESTSAVPAPPPAAATAAPSPLPPGVAAAPRASVALPAVAGAEAPTEAARPPAPHPAAAPAAEPVAVPPAGSPATALGQFVRKLTELAEAIAPRSPDLAGRLAALAEKLGSSPISPRLLADLGRGDMASPDGTGLDRALGRLLAASQDMRGAPAQQATAAVRPALPESAAAPQKAVVAAVAAPRTQAAPASESDAVPSAEPRIGTTVGAEDPGDRGTRPPQPAIRVAVAEAAVAATARPEAPAEPAAAGQPVPQPTAAAAAGSVPKSVHAAYQAPVHQINVPQVAFEVVRNFQAGTSRFQIRLDPPELGRIDVKLDVDQGGNINARMTVERAETLDLMQRDQRALERALAQAGLDGARTSLEFSLRQNPSGRDDGGDGRPGGSSLAGGSAETATPADVPEQALPLYRGSISASGVNLIV